MRRNPESATPPAELHEASHRFKAEALPEIGRHPTKKNA
jgi:hypothetical protein